MRKRAALCSLIALGALAALLARRPDGDPAPRLDRPTISQAAPGAVRGFEKLPSPSPASENTLLTRLQATPEARRLLNPPDGEAARLVRAMRPAELAHAVGTAREISRGMAACLARADLCGQIPADPGAYFEPTMTPGHRILNKSLQFLKAAADFSELRQGFPSEAELLANLRVGNPETRILSLELLLRDPPADALRADLLAAAPLIQGEAKPRYLKMMEAVSPGSARPEFLSAFYGGLAADDALTVSLTVKRLDALRLSESEFSRAIPPLCRFKREGNLPAWRQIEAGLNFYHETHAFRGEANPARICG